MDPSQLLLWFAGISSVTTLLAARRQGGGDRSWVALAVVVGALCASGAVIGWSFAGWLAGAVWVPLVATPLVLLRMASRAAGLRRYARARRLAAVAAFLHPGAHERALPAIFGALAQIQRGHLDAGLAVLRALAGTEPMAARALAQVELRWEAIVEEVARARGGPTQVPLETVIRAFGELGALAPMLSVYGYSAARGRPRAPSIDATAATFAGRPDLVRALQAGVLADEDAATHGLRLAAAHQAAGEYEVAQTFLAPLLDSDDHLVRRVARARLARPLAPVPLRPASGEVRVGLHSLEVHSRELAELGTIWHPRRRPRPRATWGILAVLAAVFIAEIPGGVTNFDNLARMGALLMPAEHLGDSWWRVLAANFLHYGFLHVALNSGGLWLFGRFLEPVIGPARLAIGYVLSGTLALATLLAYATWTQARPEELVGASASVMGLVGMTLGVLGLRYRRRATPLLRRQLIVIASVVALQVFFDAMTPIVSGGAHLAGFGYGLVFGLLFGSRRAAASPASGSRDDALPASTQP